jgi:hypothetical protein
MRKVTYLQGSTESITEVPADGLQELRLELESQGCTILMVEEA